MDKGDTEKEENAAKFLRLHGYHIDDFAKQIKLWHKLTGSTTKVINFYEYSLWEYEGSDYLVKGLEHFARRLLGIYWQKLLYGNYERDFAEDNRTVINEIIEHLAALKGE